MKSEEDAANQEDTEDQEDAVDVHKGSEESHYMFLKSPLRRTVVHILTRLRKLMGG